MLPWEAVTHFKLCMWGNYHPERSRQENYGGKGDWRRNVCVQVITPCSIIDGPSQSETLMGISGLESYNTVLHLINGWRPLDQFLQHYEINCILPQNPVVVLTPNVMVFGDTTFGRRLSLALGRGFSCWDYCLCKKRYWRDYLKGNSNIWELRERAAICKQGKEISTSVPQRNRDLSRKQGNWIVHILTLDLSASRTARKWVLLFIWPSLWCLVMVGRLTKVVRVCQAGKL